MVCSLLLESYGWGTSLLEDLNFRPSLRLFQGVYVLVLFGLEKVATALLGVGPVIETLWVVKTALFTAMRQSRINASRPCCASEARFLLVPRSEMTRYQETLFLSDQGLLGSMYFIFHCKLRENWYRNILSLRCGRNGSELVLHRLSLIRFCIFWQTMVNINFQVLPPSKVRRLFGR